jgi:hypothetical protein
MNIKTLIAALSLSLLTASVHAAGWSQNKKIVKVRVQAGDAWFQPESDSKIYGFDPTTADGKNFLATLLAAKSSGQKIEWRYDSAVIRYKNTDGSTLGYLCQGVALNP